MITPIRANYDAKGIEKDIQEYWKSEHAYEKTREARKDGKKFYFVDGPPYTTGAIHLGTAMNKTVKDIMIRYWSMNGYNIRDSPVSICTDFPSRSKSRRTSASIPRRTSKSLVSISLSRPANRLHKASARI